MIKFLENESIFLSPITNNDLEDFILWVNDLSVTSLTGRPFPVSSTFETEWINKMSSSQTDFVFTINLKSGVKIGVISLKNIDWKNKTTELGIMIPSPKYRGKGYGLKACKLLIDYCFKYLNLHSISSTVFSFNKPAQQLFNKLGFKMVGKKREAYFMGGKYHDAFFFDLININI